MELLHSAEPKRRELAGRLTPFIGRRDDLDNLFTLLQDPFVRLITILGAGGLGKTCLALELAVRLQDKLQKGVVFVPLAQLNSIDELLPALAEAFGIQLPPGGELQQVLMHHLHDRQMLLVLDNFEHLLQEALLINDILAAGAGVKVLVTSREKLGLEAETLYPLRGLELPPQGSLLGAEDYDAVQLFLRKARQARPGFSLNAANTPAVVRLCQVVDGNPLGILLAAARLEHFSPAEVVEQINSSLDFLSRDLRDGEPRHSSMRAVFASTFSQLDEHLQAVFRKLAVFRGGFDLAAAEAIAGADLPSLIALANKSLLARSADTGRYDLHELLRQYAGEELPVANEREEAIAAHTRHYIAFIRERESRLTSRAQITAVSEIETDFDNIRQACSQAAEARDFATARAALPGLYAFCDMRSRFYEGEAIFRLASEGLAPRAGEAPHPAWALALLSWYDMRAYIEPFESFGEISLQAQRCLAQARSIHDAQGIAASLVLLGAIAEDQRDFVTANRNYEEALQLYLPLDDAYWVNMRIGLCYEDIQRYSEAIQAFQVSLERGKIMGERVKMGWSLYNIGDILLRQGDLVEAQRFLEQSLKLFHEIGTPLGVLCANYRLGKVALDLGQPALARERAEIAGQLARQIQSASWLRKTDELLQGMNPDFAGASHEAEKSDQGQTEETFSQRELEVLQLLKSELNGPEIARRLVVSLNTVRYHTKNIYQKLGANNRLEAIRRAKELGL